jgi:phosphotriesterase-related protein
MPKLFTTLGAKRKEEVGLILAHEHVFTDLRTPNEPGYGQGEAADVIQLMKPELEKVRQVGVSVVVECTPEGVGRRVDILKAVSEAANFPLVVPTGIYREPWVPQWAYEASEDRLYEWLLKDLSEQIGETGVKAGFIKLSAGDSGITETETKIFRAAVRAAKESGAVIGSHTIHTPVVRDQLAIIEQLGHTPERFIWIHAQEGRNLGENIEIARRGAWIELDGIGEGNTSFYLERIQGLLDAGLGDQVLLSHDRGWYDPAKPGGGTPMPMTYICEGFLPKLRQAGVDEVTIKKLTEDNPFRAFAR